MYGLDCALKIAGGFHFLHHLFYSFQQASGCDLAIMLVDVLGQSNTPATDAYFSKLSQLFSMINADVVERDTFLVNALQWSIKGSQTEKTGHPQLHQRIAQAYWAGNFIRHLLVRQCG